MRTVALRHLPQEADCGGQAGARTNWCRTRRAVARTPRLFRQAPGRQRWRAPATAPMPVPMKRPPDRLKRRLLRLYGALAARLGPQGWWPARSRFEVAVGAILTQHTAWTGAERAIRNLREARRLDALRLAALPVAALGRLIRPAGTYRVKAQRLRAFVAFLVRRFGGRMAPMRLAPLGALRDELLGVSGIGPESADSILLYAAGRPVFVVDAYTRRVMARHRITPEEIGYEELRALFEDHLPRDPRLFNEFHALLVAVGKQYCLRRPHCEQCPLRFDLKGRPPRE